MAYQLETEIRIKASTEKIWRILTDFEGYSKWNPFIRTLTGDVLTGKQITVKIQPPGSKGMTFRPKILVREENRELRWLGHLLAPGLFDGEHYFLLQPNEDGTTTFVHGENFRGILLPLLKKQLQGTAKDGFIQMNEKLKMMAEE